MRRASRNQKHRHNKTGPQLPESNSQRRWSVVIPNLLSLLLFIATAALAGLGLLQWRTMNMSIRQTQDLVRFAKQQADASEKAAKAASDSALAANKSTEIAEKATSLAQNEFLSSRMVTWKATYDEKTKNLLLMPVDNGVVLQEALIFYIDQDENGWNTVSPQGDSVEKGTPRLRDLVVVPPRFEVYLRPVLYTCCERMWQHQIETKGSVSGGVSVTYIPIPLVISASYITKGAAQKDTSLYRIHARYHLRPKEVEKCEFDFLSLYFVRRLSKKEDIKTVLDQEWHKAIKQRSYLSGFPKETAIKPLWE